MMKNKSKFPNEMWEVLSTNDRKVKKNPKISPVDVIVGRFKV